MKLYIPKIIADTPTKLPHLEKIIFYYILDYAFKNQIENSANLDFEIDTNNLIQVLNNTSIKFVDLKSQTNAAIDNLTNIKLSLVDNNFHIKLSPIDGIYQLGSLLYVTLNPIVIDYLDQILDGNYVTIDLLTATISELDKEPLTI